MRAPLLSLFVALAIVTALAVGPAQATVINDGSLVFHIDAQDLDADGMTGDQPADDASVTAWNDFSANGRNFSTVAGDPHFRATGAGGASLSYVEFDRNGGAADERMNTASMAATDFAGAGGDTINTFYVLRRTGGVVYAKAEFGSGSNRYGLEGASRFDFPNDNTGKLEGWSSTLGDNAWHILEVRADSATQAVYLDGDLVASQAQVGGVTGNAPMNIGGNNGGQNNLSAVVDFAEIAHYNRALDNGERNQIGAFLDGKYGIATTYQPVPEPASLALGLLGLAGLGWFVYHRRRAARQQA